MVCLYCGKKLTVVKKLSSDEFCSPAHKQSFLQQHEKLALARLLESQGRLGSAPRRAKVDLAEVAAAAQQKKANQKKEEWALQATEPDFGEFLGQQISTRRYVGPIWQNAVASPQKRPPAIPSSELGLRRPSVSASAVEMEVVGGGGFDRAAFEADVIGSLRALHLSTASHDAKLVADVEQQGKEGGVKPFPWLALEAPAPVCPRTGVDWGQDVARGELDVEALLPLEWRLDWSPRQQAEAALGAEPLGLRFPELELETVAFNAGASEAEIDAVAAGPLAEESAAFVEQLSPEAYGPAADETVSASRAAFGAEAFAGADVIGVRLEGLLPELGMASEGEPLSPFDFADVVVSEAVVELEARPAQLPFQGTSYPSFQYDRRLRRLPFSFRLPIPGMEAVLPDLRPAHEAEPFASEVEAKLEVSSGLQVERRTALDSGEGQCLAIGSADSLPVIAAQPGLNVPGACVEPVDPAASVAILSRPDCRVTELRGPRAGRPVPIPLLLHASLPAQEFLPVAAAPLVPSKHYPRLSCGVAPATVDLAPFSAMSQLAGGNVDLSLATLKKHWREAPSDLRWIALAVPLVLGLIWYSFTPGAQRFTRDASRGGNVQSGATAEAATSEVATSEVAAIGGAQGLNPSGVRVGFLEKLIPGDSMVELKAGIMRRAAVELGDDFRQGLADWSGEGDWARGWRYDPAGFVRPRKLALYTPTLSLENYRFEFLGQIERKALSWVFRAADAQNYQVAKLEITRPGPVPTVELVRYAVHNGRAGPKKSIPLPMQVYMDEIYRVRVDVSGQDYITSVKGMVVDVFSDPSIARGGVGFFADPGEESRLRWVEVSHQYDFLGRLCAFLVPYSVPNSNVRTDQ
jgi:hypothetical protein